ncbi:hypothetical protein [Croceimicrobium sp.]|uniref:hypothetical protein n=1 Tax=Croceimicrobium sp. TaxID=2828340 RepID=UPI003BA937CD
MLRKFLFIARIPFLGLLLVGALAACKPTREQAVSEPDLYSDLVFDLQHLVSFTYGDLRSDFQREYKRIKNPDVYDSLMQEMVQVVEEMMLISGEYGGGLDPHSLRFKGDTSTSMAQAAITENIGLIQRMKSLRDSLQKSDWSFEQGSGLKREALKMSTSALLFYESVQAGEIPLGRFHYRMLVYAGQSYYWGIKFIRARSALRQVEID